MIPPAGGGLRTADDYSESEHATLDFGQGGKSTIDEALAAQSIHRQVALSAPDAFVLGALLRGTPLIATMQSRLGRTIFSDLAWCEPPVYLPRQRFHLVWHRRSGNSPRTAWLREMILSVSEMSALPTANVWRSASTKNPAAPRRCGIVGTPYGNRTRLSRLKIWRPNR